MRKQAVRIIVASVLVSSFASGALLLRDAPPSVQAQGYNVDTYKDAVDALPGDGRCETIAGECSLRAAIQEANAQPFASTITLSGSSGLTIEGLEDNGAAGDLDIHQSMTINGRGSSITSYANDRIFDVHDVTVVIDNVDLNGDLYDTINGGAIHNSDQGVVYLSDSIITQSTASQGGAIYNDGGTVTLQDSSLFSNLGLTGGGAIYNNGGTLTMTNSHLHDNSAIGSAGGGLFSEDGYVSINQSSIAFGLVGLLGGGGIYSVGDHMVLNQVALYGNDSPTDGGGILSKNSDLMIVASAIYENSASSGGGIYSEAGPSPLTITDSFIGSNSALAGGGLYSNGVANLRNTAVTSNNAANGGAIFNNYEMEISNITISANTATSSGGGIYNSTHGVLFSEMSVEGTTIALNTSSDGGGIYNDGTTSLRLTIVAGNSGGNCGGTAILSLGYNLEDANTCGFSATGDLVNAAPVLGPLANNGGPTQTHALLAGSDAIDAGGDCPPPNEDQRGALRPADGDGDTSSACDIGAYEAGVSPFTPTPSPTGTPVFPTATPDPMVKDTDGDGCADGEETGTDPLFGGMRNPKHYWDFYDVPAGDNPIRDQSVSALDFFALLARFSATGDPAMSPFAFVPPPPTYHTAFDRGPFAGPDLWDLTSPNGSIAATDLFAMLAQFGHSCA